MDEQDNKPAISVYEVLKYLRNFFPGRRWSLEEEAVTEGEVALPELQKGDMYLIEGSRRNDGVHVYGSAGLYGETISGVATEICVPDDLTRLIGEINEWQEKYSEAIASPYTSESFGGYSYTKASSIAEGNTAVSWKTQFKGRLAAWRKL
jgi:hypothetical protein